MYTEQLHNLLYQCISSNNPDAGSCDILVPGGLDDNVGNNADTQEDFELDMYAYIDALQEMDETHACMSQIIAMFSDPSINMTGDDGMLVCFIDENNNFDIDDNTLLTLIKDQCNGDKDCESKVFDCLGNLAQYEYAFDYSFTAGQIEDYVFSGGYDLCDKTKDAFVEEMDCILAIEDFEATFGIKLTEEERFTLMNSGSSCGSDGFEQQIWEVLLDDFAIFGEPGNPCEQELLLQYPWEAYVIWLNSITAINVTQQRFEGQNLDFHLDCADAFRHTFFNALNTQEVGAEIAVLFSDAHECNGSNNDAQMDYWNNGVGHSLGLQYPNVSENVVADRVCDKLEAGHLKILSDEDDPDSSIIDSHHCNCN